MSGELWTIVFGGPRMWFVSAHKFVTEAEANEHIAGLSAFYKDAFAVRAAAAHTIITLLSR